MVRRRAREELPSGADDWLPDLLHLTHPKTPQLTRDFLSKRKNGHTQLAYFRILKAFLLWAERSDLPSLVALTTTDIANYVRGLLPVHPKADKPELSNRTRAQIIACLRGYFDALVRGGALPSNPAASVEIPSVKAKLGHYKPLEPEQMGGLLDSIQPESIRDLQDRAVIALMAFSCARVGAVTKMKLGDVYERAGRLHVHLTEKREAEHDVPCHPELEEYLRAFMARSAKKAADCDENPARWLFRRWSKKRKALTGSPLTHMMCYTMVKRRSKAAGLPDVTNHSFRATGITTFLRSGGALDDARRLANHASVNTTKLYDHRTQAVSVEDAERISYRRIKV